MQAAGGCWGRHLILVYELASGHATGIFVRDSSFYTASLSVHLERLGGIGSFEALELPGLEATYATRSSGVAAQIDSAGGTTDCST